jgi:hypothetical protein
MDIERISAAIDITSVAALEIKLNLLGRNKQTNPAISGMKISKVNEFSKKLFNS